jgi:hypothetical protein
MKKILITLAMGFLMTPAFAGSISGETFLVRLVSAKVIVDDMCAPNSVVCPTVEPITIVEFEYSSCRQFDSRDFIANTMLVDGTGVVNIGIELPRTMVDCFGPVTTRTYDLSLNDHRPSLSYRFLNVMVPDFK